MQNFGGVSAEFISYGNSYTYINFVMAECAVSRQVSHGLSNLLSGVIKLLNLTLIRWELVYGPNANKL